MNEWSQNNHKKNGYHSLKESLPELFYSSIKKINQASYTPTNKINNIDDNIINFDCAEMKNYLQSSINEYNLHDIILKECQYSPKTWAEMNKNFTDFHHLRKNFLKLIGYSYYDNCLKEGLSNYDINLLKQKQTPENYNVHIKIPFDFGGLNDFNNLCFIKTHPIHDKIHNLITLQISSGFLKRFKFIYIPWVEGTFYND